MKDKLLQEICEYCIKRSNFSFGKEDFFEMIDSHEQGKTKLLELWDKEHEEDNFPPEDLTEQGYYFSLLARDIITTYQYDILMKDFV